MKKNYVSPVANAYNVAAQYIMAGGSPTTVEISDQTADPGEGLAKDRSIADVVRDLW